MGEAMPGITSITGSNTITCLLVAFWMWSLDIWLSYLTPTASVHLTFTPLFLLFLILFLRCCPSWPWTPRLRWSPSQPLEHIWLQCAQPPLFSGLCFMKHLNWMTPSSLPGLYFMNVWLGKGRQRSTVSGTCLEWEPAMLRCRAAFFMWVQSPWAQTKVAGLKVNTEVQLLLSPSLHGLSLYFSSPSVVFISRLHLDMNAVSKNSHFHPGLHTGIP